MNNLIKKLRQTDEDIKDIILKNITVHKQSKIVEFTFVNNKVIEKSKSAKIKKFLQDFTPDYFSVESNFIKQVCDEEILKISILSYLKENYLVMSSFVKDGDVSAYKDCDTFIYEIKAGENSFNYFNENQLINNLNHFLNENFCENFTGKLVLTGENINAAEILKKAAQKEIESVDVPVKKRIFKIENYKEIDGGLTDEYAIYMADCDFETENLTVCGEIKSLEQKMTKTGKPFFVFELDDGTYGDGISTFKAKLFPRKKTLENMAELKAGDSVVLNGKNEAFNGRLSMFIKSINYASVPKDFVPEKKPSKKPFASYITITPEPYSEFEQSNLFEKKKALPAELVNNDFVVFDLETTGLVNSPIGYEKMDTIIEIGAVKMKNGVISEKFSTLVKPDRIISAEITKITGIDNEMVKDAPTLDKVIPDFFKFTRGCHLVGHNVNFDYKFVNYYSKEMGYILDNRCYDTLKLSQKLLFLSNNKLNTVAEHFGFTFNHHRAFDDALVTAKIFIEFITMQNCLPK